MSKHDFFRKIYKLEQGIIIAIKREIKRIHRQVTFIDFSNEVSTYLKGIFEEGNAFYVDHFDNLMLAGDSREDMPENFENYIRDCEFSTKMLAHMYEELTEIAPWQHQCFEIVYQGDGESRYFTVSDLIPLSAWNEEYANKINTDRFYLIDDGILNEIEAQILLGGRSSCVFFYVRGPKAVMAYMEGRLFPTSIKVNQIK